MFSILQERIYDVVRVQFGILTNWPLWKVFDTKQEFENLKQFSRKRNLNPTTCNETFFKVSIHQISKEILDEDKYVNDLIICSRKVERVWISDSFMSQQKKEVLLFLLIRVTKFQNN